MSFCFVLFQINHGQRFVSVVGRNKLHRSAVKESKMFEVGSFWLVVSPKSLQNVPFDSSLTPFCFYRGLKASSREFQWSYWLCLFGFCGETGHKGCNQAGCCCACQSSLFIVPLLLGPLTIVLHLPSSLRH